MKTCLFPGEDEKKAEEKVVTSTQLLQVIEEAYPNSLTLDDMSRCPVSVSTLPDFTKANLKKFYPRKWM
jgi:hypothetical protein